MLQQFSSMDAARHAFDEYATLEPELAELWTLCRDAAPHTASGADVADAYDVDLYDVDELAATAPDDGWCAEDFFGQHVKSRLMLLVGWYRTSGPDELRSTKAYDIVYAALFDWALDRHCTCCADAGADAFGTDAFGADASGADASGADAFGADAFGADAFGADAFGADAFGADAGGDGTAYDSADSSSDASANDHADDSALRPGPDDTLELT